MSNLEQQTIDKLFRDLIRVYSTSATSMIGLDSIKMAIYEINNNGGIKVRGKKYKIEYLLEDGASDPNTFKLKSEKLINTNKVLPSIKSPFFANHFLFSDAFLLFVDTISPLSKKKSDILIA